jgi:phosphoribosylglycinamide formyltransferase-1
MRGIVAAIRAGALDAEPVLLVSNNADAPALVFALDAEIPAQCIRTLKDPAGADTAMAEAFDNAGAELLVLSGYLRRLGPVTLGAFRNRILNIHPGPLPAFGGEGMYGRRVHEAVIAAGARASGICIHLVDEVYDHGPVIALMDVPLRPGDTAETLEARVTAAEPGFYVETLQAIAAGRLVLPST